LSSAGKKTARFLLAGACDSYVFYVSSLRSLRWLETPLNSRPCYEDCWYTEWPPPLTVRPVSDNASRLVESYEIVSQALKITARNSSYEKLAKS